MKPREFCLRECSLIINNLSDAQQEIWRDKVFVREVVKIDWSKVFENLLNLDPRIMDEIQDNVESQLGGVE